MIEADGPRRAYSLYSVDSSSSAPTSEHADSEWACVPSTAPKPLGILRTVRTESTSPLENEGHPDKPSTPRAFARANSFPVIGEPHEPAPRMVRAASLSLPCPALVPPAPMPLNPRPPASRDATHSPPSTVTVLGNTVTDVTGFLRKKRWHRYGRWPLVVDEAGRTAEWCHRQLEAAVVKVDVPFEQLPRAATLRKLLLRAMRNGEFLIIDVGSGSVGQAETMLEAIQPGLWDLVLSQAVLGRFAELVRPSDGPDFASTTFTRLSRFAVVFAATSMTVAQHPLLRGRTIVHRVSDKSRSASRSRRRS